jgi:hypothetical protein
MNCRTLSFLAVDFPVKGEQGVREPLDRWAAQIGTEQLGALEAHLTQLTRNRPPE